MKVFTLSPDGVKMVLDGMTQYLAMVKEREDVPENMEHSISYPISLILSLQKSH